jgi:multiple sugar transport system permease protein
LGAFEALFSDYAGMGVPIGVTVPAGGGAEAGLEQQRLNEAFRMSGTLIAITPLFVLYLVVQRQFIKGIENTGLTGL